MVIWAPLEKIRVFFDSIRTTDDDDDDDDSN